MNYDYVGHMRNTRFTGILVFAVESWLQWESAESSLTPSISQTPECTVSDGQFQWSVRALVTELDWMDLCPLLPVMADPPVIDILLSKERTGSVKWLTVFAYSNTFFYICRWWHIFMWLRNEWIKACLCCTRCHMWLKKSRMRLVSVYASPSAAVFRLPSFCIQWAPKRLLSPLRDCPWQQALGLRLGEDTVWMLQNSQSEYFVPRIFTVPLRKSQQCSE